MINTNADILVVDDMPPMLTFISGNLRSLGFKNIKAVASAREAIDVLKTQQITLVLTDWNMPVMSGLELLKWIRQESRNNKFTPVIMVTAEVNRQQVAEAISCGVTDFVLKPFTVNTLSERIQKALSSKGKQTATPAGTHVKQAENSLSNTAQMQPPQREESLSNNQNEEISKRLTILAVDDTPDNLTLISNLFQKDYRVKIASNGEKALKICESDDRPDIVLLDIMMPGIDGYEVIRRLKANEGTSELPVIFITALNDADSIVKGLEAGAVDYITKPIEPSVAIARVKNFLRYHRGYEELKATLDTMIENARLREDVEHMVRHDMKGPLSAIIGLVSQGVAEKNLPLENIKMIETAAYTMLNMISLSTDLYKMETGRFALDVKGVDIIRLIARVSEEIRSGFTSKRLSINSKMLKGSERPELNISGDELLCYSLLHNLIKNAAEASPVGGSITIEIFDDDMVKIAIHNDGAVPEPIREKFFEKYVTMGKQGGTGLGTYSARLITEAQKGTINMHTSDKAGTTIEISLPRWR
ncbi:MAG: response regulator [Nitrospirae bacterium]|nr:response regulator [Nitrospirota bacterium]